MKTIFFSNRERIMIGEDHVQYMNYLQKKLPGAAYTDDESDNKNDTKISIGEDALNSKRQQYPSQVFNGGKKSFAAPDFNANNAAVQGHNPHSQPTTESR